MKEKEWKAHADKCGKVHSRKLKSVERGYLAVVNSSFEHVSFPDAPAQVRQGQVLLLPGKAEEIGSGKNFDFEQIIRGTHGVQWKASHEKIGMPRRQVRDEADAGRLQGEREEHVLLLSLQVYST